MMKKKPLNKFIINFFEKRENNQILRPIKSSIFISKISMNRNVRFFEKQIVSLQKAKTQKQLKKHYQKYYSIIYYNIHYGYYSNKLNGNYKKRYKPPWVFTRKRDWNDNM